MDSERLIELLTGEYGTPFRDKEVVGALVIYSLILLSLSRVYACFAGCLTTLFRLHDPPVVYVAVCSVHGGSQGSRDRPHILRRLYCLHGNRAVLNALVFPLKIEQVQIAIWSVLVKGAYPYPLSV